MRHLVELTLVAGLMAATTLGCKSKDAEPKPAATATAKEKDAPAPKPAPNTPAPSAKPTHDKNEPPTPPPAPAAAPVLGDEVKVPQAHVAFNAPGGWKPFDHTLGWKLYKAPDNFARLGFVTFTQPGESTSRLGQLAEAFDLSNLSWGEAGAGTVGKDHFPDREGVTKSCTLKNGDPCDMKYMTINPGGSTQMMVVYLVNTAHGEALRSHANASVSSLRKL